PGEIGPFSLITYDDLKRRVTQIAKVTARPGLMPPWKPLGPVDQFEDDRRLRADERAVISAWLREGAPEGDPRDLPPAPTWKSGWGLGAPDLVVTMPQAYTVPPAGGDTFRTFVLPIPVTRARYVRAMEFRPDNPRVVHHASIGVDRTKSSRRLDERDPEPGYVGGMVPDARYPEGQLLGWTPGQSPRPSPPGTAWRLDPASDLVVQVHMQPTGKPEPLRVSAAFYFTDDPPTRTPLGLRLGSETIDIPPGEREYVLRDSYVLPVDVEILAIQPHAHNLARRMDAKATLPDGRTRDLIAIADWDFRWQDVYRYKSPVLLPKGSTIAMRYTYDNSAANVRNPMHPPKRVVWGQNTTDEMGDLWIQVVPVSPGDAAVLGQDFRRKAHAEDVAAYTKLLREEPNNPLRHDAAGDLYLEDRRFDDAIAEYRKSLALNPESASTHYNLGYALSARGRTAEAADAVSEFREALRIDPEYAQGHTNLGALLQLQGKTDEALDHFRRAAAIRPDFFDARINLAQLLSAGGRSREAMDAFRAALALRADDPRALSGLAWIQATAADADLRNADEAVRLAERAAVATRRRDISVLDALAAAYASAGRFAEATTAAREGIALATSAGLSAAASQLRDRLLLYEKGQPYRR
ncbi:MAG TPA: tetratricopeptide repeat protein, partial [Vicinamibacterales bacterium]|nr:tetratricopeptide repeat protein [Vicinamibacterales bacterium]